MSNLEITELRDWGKTSSLEKEWDSLVMECEDCHIFQLYGWHDSWWRSFGTPESLSVWTLRKNGALHGIIPLTKTEIKLGPFTLNASTFIGSENFSSDYITPIFSKDLTEEEKITFIDKVCRSLKNSSALSFTNIRSDSSLPRFIQNEMSKSSPYSSYSPYSSWQFNPKKKGDYAEVITKKSLKRVMSYFSKQPNYSAKHFLDKNEILERLDPFFTQHRERWELEGIKSQFIDETQRTFYRAVTESLGAKKKIVFTELSTDDSIVAYHFGFHFKDTFYWYKPTFNPALKERSPGKALLRELFLWCEENNISTFDFTVGDESFKKQFANTEIPILNFVRYRNTPQRALSSAIQSLRGVKRLIVKSKG